MLEDFTGFLEVIFNYLDSINSWKRVSILSVILIMLTGTTMISTIMFILYQDRSYLYQQYFDPCSTTFPENHDNSTSATT